jgi:tetratricopeptide (TPR) repeat protein
MDMMTQEKLDACVEFRELGNLFFQHGEYQRAAYHYHKALVYFEYIFPDTDAETEHHDALKLKVLLNFAACRLKTGHLEDVVQHADQALALDVANVKALYRRAQAHRLRDDFDRAMQDINRAIEIAQAEDASDPLLVQEKALLQAKMLAYKLKSKQVSSAMFRSKESKEDSPKQRQQQRSSALPDASVLRLNLQAKQSVDTAPEIAAFDSWQPCCLGLQELESILAKLT